MKRSRMVTTSIFGVFLLLANLFFAWLQCSCSSASDYLLNALVVAFTIVIECLLIAVIYYLLKLGQCLKFPCASQLSKTRDRCKALSKMSVVLILSFFGVSFVWTAFIVAILYLPYHLSSLPFNWWQMLWYITIAFDLAFHLSAEKIAKSCVVRNLEVANGLNNTETNSYR